MSIRRYTVTRIDVDYYTVREEELIVRRKVTFNEYGNIIAEKSKAQWDFICSYGGQWPEDGIPDEAKDNNPRITLRKNDDYYVFYACVYHFPDPRLMGKWKDYTSAYGFDEP